MELVYLWVKKYKNIEEEGFNFSSKFQCNFNQEKLELSITKNDNYINNFFGDKINVTGIVGENGSGKSSILEILSNKYNEFDISAGLFFVFYDNNNDKILFRGAKEKEKVENIYKLELQQTINALKNTTTIYFSNILNEQDLYTPIFRQEVNYSHMLNISTTQVLSQMKYIDTASNHFMGSSSTSFDKVYRSYRIQQISNSLILLKDTAIQIPFNLPEKVVIRNINFRDHIQSLQDKFEDHEYRKILEVIDNSNSDDLLFENYLTTNLIISLLLENMDRNNPFRADIMSSILNAKMNSSLNQFYENVRTALKDKKFNLNGEPVSFKIIDDFFFLADKLIKEMKKFDTSESFQSEYEMELNIKKSNFDFLDTYEKLIQQSEYFLDINWRGISSGEESFLYEFSRFYHLSKGYKSDPYLSLGSAENLMILIDEGETTFHPQWQKEYIKYLTIFFEKNFTQKIHLILTSHSPFLVSDLPRDNILFLINGKEEKSFDIKETFGANIHTLLSNRFFIKNGLMGEYAKDTIEEVIDFLNNNKSKMQSIDTVEKIINIIGEPVLKMRLEQMLTNYKVKHGINKKDELEKQIKYLQKQLDDI